MRIERAKDGAATHASGLVTVGVALGTKHIALNTGLFFEHTALILPVVSVRGTAGAPGGG